MRNHDGWDIHNLAHGDNERIQAQEILHIDDNLNDVLAKSNLILTSMGANHLEHWAAQIRGALCNRLQSGEIDLVLAENHPRPAVAVREALLEGVTNQQKSSLKAI